MAEEKKVVTLDDFEQRLMVSGLMDFRNDLLRDEKPTEDINDLILKVIDTQLKKHWLDLTGTDSPYAWSNKYGMPILAMVPDAEMSIARKVFGFINSKTKDEESIATAEDYLSKITYADKLSSKSERYKEFR